LFGEVVTDIAVRILPFERNRQCGTWAGVGEIQQLKDGPCFITVDKLLLLPQSSRNTSRPRLVSSKGILPSENESANFHCEEICRVRTEGKYAFKNYSQTKLVVLHNAH
jgi:hypothetical protein